MTWEVMALLSTGIVAGVGWDIARRYVEASCFNEAALSRISELEREREKYREQMTAVLSKLNAAQAAVQTRLRGVGAPR